MFLCLLTFATPVGHRVGEVAHDYVPALRQWLATKGIRNSYDSWHGRSPTKALDFTSSYKIVISIKLVTMVEPFRSRHYQGQAQQDAQQDVSVIRNGSSFFSFPH